jgi:hypothetical protein
VSFTFHTPENELAGTPYTVTVVSPGASSGSRTVGITGWPAPWTVFPKIVTAIRNYGTSQAPILEIVAAYEATGYSGGNLALSGVYDGYTDAALASGDTLELRPTKASQTELQNAIAAVDAALEALAQGSAGDLQSNNGTGGFAGGGPNWSVPGGGAPNILALPGAVNSGGGAYNFIICAKSDTNWGFSLYDNNSERDTALRYNAGGGSNPNRAGFFDTDSNAWVLNVDQHRNVVLPLLSNGVLSVTSGIVSAGTIPYTAVTGLGSAALVATTYFDLAGAAAAAQAASQPLSSTLTGLAAATYTSGHLLEGQGTGVPATLGVGTGLAISGGNLTCTVTSAVSSVFTRTGAVTAQTGDYAVGQVTGAAPLASPPLTGTPTFAGSTSGTTGLKAAAAASGTLTLPAATDILATEGFVTGQGYLSGTVAIVNGGSGQTTAAAAFNALSPMTALGDLIYGGAAGAGTRLGGNVSATTEFLMQTGTGSASAAPGWGALAAANIPKTLDHTWITDFLSTVESVSLDAMTAPAASVSWNSNRLTNLANPTGAQDAATKSYVDGAIQGTQVKPSALVATTAALPANTYLLGVITFTATGTVTVDGHALALADLVLVLDEAAAANNGLYTVTTAPAIGVQGVLTRQADMAVSADFGGALIAVETGTVNAGSLWLCTTQNPTVGTTAIAFTELNKGYDLQPGTGIAIAANTVSVTAPTLVSSGSYSNPAWLTSILGSIVSGNIAGNAASITGTITTSQVSGLAAYITAFGFITGNQTITVSGDASGSGTTALALTLDTVNANVGAFTYAALTVNAKGLVTAASSGTTPLLPANNLSDLASAATACTNLGAMRLKVVGPQTANYNLNAGEFALGNTTSGSLIFTLPTAPANGTVCGAKMTILGGANTLTIACGGADVLNKAGGGTTLTLSLLNQGVLLQYQSSGALWANLSDDLPLSQLDARYQAGPLTGDVTTSGAVATLATVNSNVGTFTAATVTVNAKGLVTAATAVVVPVDIYAVTFGSSA